MDDIKKTKDQLLLEITELRKRNTALEKANAELNQSEKSFRELAEKANDGIIIINKNGEFLYVNERTTELFGYSLEELFDTTIKELIDPSEREIVIERMKKRFNGESVPNQYESVFSKKNNEQIPIELNAGIINWEGSPADMAIIRDISDRKKTELALSESEKNIV